MIAGLGEAGQRSLERYGSESEEGEGERKVTQVGRTQDPCKGLPLATRGTVNNDSDMLCLLSQIRGP